MRYLVVLILLVTVLWFVGVSTDRAATVQREQGQREEVQREMAVFLGAQLPELQRLLDDLQSRETDVQHRIETYEGHLQALGRDVATDPDLDAWTAVLWDLSDQRQTAREAAERAFLAKKAYDLAPAADSRARADASLRAAVVASDAVRARYRALGKEVGQ